MKRFRISKKTIYVIVGLVLSLAVSLVLFCVREKLIQRELSQQMAERWGEKGEFAQISCFFSRNAYMSKEQLINFEHVLDNALKEASIVLESENESARLWTDAFSAPGKISVSTDRASLSLNAIGIEGDFFQFHPQELLYGNYFNGKEINNDHVVIDEEIAWQLFGGIDVSGKIINVGGKPHVISGVIKRPQGKKEQAAGLQDPLIYVSMDTLSNYGNIDSINHYEIVMPNPIKDFALQMVKDNLWVDANEVEYVENTGRYSIVAAFDNIRNYAYRSMNGKAIIYPYWENLARSLEDVLALITLFMVLFFGVPAMVVLGYLIYRWKHKNWTVKSILTKVLDALGSLKYKILSKRRVKRKEPIHITFDEEEENEKG